ncbi:MAG TPA: homoserine kinase [Abditibacterium sp.]|jgi:homoserine kinase
MPVFPAVFIRVPATSANLGPGFDALGVAFRLHNEIQLQESERDSFSATGEGAEELSHRRDTIAHRAAHRVFAALRLEVAGFHLQLHNRIPFARGLGSSSAAIVGGLVAANECARRATGRALSPEKLLDLATEIEGHPDNVAPALLGGLVVAATRENGSVAAVSVPVARFPKFAVWIPDAQLETKVARGVLPSHYSRADAIFNLSRSALLVGALAAGDFSSLSEALRDKIHQDFRAPLVPGFDAISRAALSAGALGVTLSGAGPSILAWMPGETAPIIAAIENAARESNVAGRVEELEVDLSGCQIVN